MKNLYSLAVAQLTVGGTGSEAGVTPVGEEDMEWMKENLLLEQLNAAIAALGTEEVRWGGWNGSPWVPLFGFFLEVC